MTPGTRQSITQSLNTLLDSLAPLQTLSGLSLPAKVSYNIFWNISHILPEIRVFEKARNSCIEKFGALNAQGKFEVLPENVPQYRLELEELLSVSITLELYLIDLAEFPTSALLKPNTLFPIAWLLKQEDTLNVT